MYTGARARAGIESMMEPKEVLIISDTGSEIMEGSLTSVFFWRGERWVTPHISSGGQEGTTRRWLLENGLCVEEVVSSDSLVDGEECWISNGVRGLIWGKIEL
jgi:branched-subunit amino acid aminotransferase/4-amino-4-deoxychorismate lyase